MLSDRSNYHDKVALKKLNQIKLEILATFQNDLTLTSDLNIEAPFDFGQWLRDIWALARAPDLHSNIQKLISSS